METAKINFEPTTLHDVDDLVNLRILTMKPSLEKIGRVDPVRARERFVATFKPTDTHYLMLEKEQIGFIVFRHEANHLLLDHLYIHPDFQGRGHGAAVLATLFAEADAVGMPIHVGALRESDSNRFYIRHGFKLVELAEWDNYYVCDTNH
jgi:GNAT superfamily N-acetyltransferase